MFRRETAETRIRILPAECWIITASQAHLSYMVHLRVRSDTKNNEYKVDPLVISKLRKL